MKERAIAKPEPLRLALKGEVIWMTGDNEPKRPLTWNQPHGSKKRVEALESIVHGKEDANRHIIVRAPGGAHGLAYCLAVRVLESFRGDRGVNHADAPRIVTKMPRHVAAHHLAV